MHDKKNVILMILLLLSCFHFTSRVAAAAADTNMLWNNIIDEGVSYSVMAITDGTAITGQDIIPSAHNNIIKGLYVLNNGSRISDQEKEQDLIIQTKNYYLYRDFDTINNNNIPILSSYIGSISSIVDANGDNFLAAIPGDASDHTNQNVIISGTGYFNSYFKIGGLVDSNKRRKLYKKLIISSVYQQEILINNSLNQKLNEDKLNALTTKYLKVAEKSNELARLLLAGADVSLTHLAQYVPPDPGAQNSLDKFIVDWAEKIEKTYKVGMPKLKNLGKALKVLKLGQTISHDVAYKLIQRTLYTQDALNRLDALIAFDRSFNYPDPQFRFALFDAQFEISAVQDSIFSAMYEVFVDNNFYLTNMTVVGTLLEAIKTKFLNNPVYATIGGESVAFVCQGFFVTVTSFINTMHVVYDKYDSLRLASLAATFEHQLSNFLTTNRNSLNCDIQQILHQEYLHNIDYFLGYLYFNTLKQALDNQFWDGTIIFDLFSWFRSGITSSDLISDYASQELRAFQLYYNHISPLFLASDDSQWFAQKITNPLIGLSDGIVTPSLGDTTTIFSFSAKYTAPVAPQFVKAIIDNDSGHVMTATGTNFNSGVIFQYSQGNCIPGQHSYSFVALDANGTSVQTATQYFNCDSLSAGHLAMTADKTTINSDGVDASNISATVKDTHGNVMPNVSVTFSSVNGVGALSPGSGTTNASGQVTTKFTCKKAGTFYIAASTSNGLYKEISVTVSQAPLTFAPNISQYSKTDTQTVYSISVRVNNASSGTSAGAGKAVTFSSSAGSLSQTSVTTDSFGDALTFLTVTSSGNVKLTMSCTGSTSDVVFYAQVGTPPLLNPMKTITGAGAYSVKWNKANTNQIATGGNFTFDKNAPLKYWDKTNWTFTSPSTDNSSALTLSPDSTQSAIGGAWSQVNGVWLGSKQVIILNNSNTSATSYTNFTTSFEGTLDVPHSISWSGSSLAMSNYYFREIKIYSTSGTLQTTITTPNGEFVNAVKYSPDGTKLAASTQEGVNGACLFIWNVGSWTSPSKWYCFPGKGNLHAIDWTYDSAKVAVGDQTGSFHIVTLSNGAKQDYVMTTPGWKVMGLQWSPDGKYLIAGADDGKVYLYNMLTGGAIWQLAGNGITDFAWEPISQYQYIAAGNGDLILYAPFDTQGPSIALTSPPNGDTTYNTSTAISGKITDNLSGVKSLTANSNPVTVNTDGTFTYNASLTAGANTITFVGTDNNGFSSSSVLTVNRITDTIVPGIANVLVSASDTTVGAIISIGATVTDNYSGITSVSAKIHDTSGNLLTTITLANAGGSSYSGSWDTASTTEKLYQIDIVATDGSANTTAATNATQVNLKTMPVISSIQKIPASPTDQLSVAISATLADTSGISSGIVGYSIDGVNWSYVSMLKISGTSTSGTWSGTVPALAIGTVQYKITATDIYGNGTISSIASYSVTDGTPPASPIGLTITPTSWSTMNNFTASWTNPSDSSGVNGVYYKLDVAPASSTDGTLISVTNITSINISVAGEGVHPIYVWLVDGANNKSWLNSSIAYLRYDSGIPIAPGNLTAASVGGTQVTLSWSPSSDGNGSGIDGYNIYRDGVKVASSLSAGYTDTGLTPFTSYSYKLEAYDFVGHVSAQTVALTVTTLEGTPPDLQVSTLPEGAITNETPVNVYGTVSDSSGIQSLVISGQTVTLSTTDNFTYMFSHPVSLASGTNSIITVATDKAGNVTTDTRTVTFDQTVPTVTVTTPADNSISNQFPIQIAGSVNEQATVMVKLNNEVPQAANMSGSNFAAAVNPVQGLNSIEVIATDLAGNTSSVVRTVTYDALSPSLAITDPNHDIFTNTSNLTLKGTVSDLASASIDTVTLTETFNENTTTYLLSVTSGSFQKTITLSSEGMYVFKVTVTDQAGNTSTVQRNIIYSLATPGDVDKIGGVTLDDALKAYLQVMNLQTITDPVVKSRCDVAPLGPDRKPAPDGVIDIGDVILIMRKYIGVETW